MTVRDLREALRDVLAEDISGRPRLYHILRAMADQAEQGNVRAAALLLDRAFGAPQPQMTDDKQRTVIYIDAATRDQDQVERPADGGAAVAEQQED